MPDTIDKIIITNESVIAEKYGSFSQVKKAIDKLIKADKARGLTTRLVRLDNDGDMADYGGPIRTHTSERATKRRVDNIYNVEEPDYMLILGGPDVIPHQKLTNPLQGDEDLDVPSDLPYACSTGYSKNIANFRGPSRVIGRIPDLPIDNADDYSAAEIKDKLETFLTIIDTAANYVSRPRSDYEDYFSVTAAVWQNSTRLSLRNVFGDYRKLARSPAQGPKWKKSELQARMHFINCHGAPARPAFYGESGGEYPEAHLSKLLRGADHITPGTVTAAECCYGAELYDSIKSDSDPCIAFAYLEKGGYGFWGSTNIAYGPPAGNGQADLITQYFLARILEGSSIGRAALQARLQFVTESTPLSPVHLKTLAQFILLGDPSVHPVESNQPELEFDAADDAVSTVAETTPKGFARKRTERRKRLWAQSVTAMLSEPYASQDGQKSPSESAGKSINSIIKQLGLSNDSITTTFVRSKGRDVAKVAAGKPPTVGHESLLHVVMGQEKVDPNAPEGLSFTKGAIILEADGDVLDIQEFSSK